MYKRAISMAVSGAMIASAALYHFGSVSASRADGYRSSVLAEGHLTEDDVNLLVQALRGHGNPQPRLSLGGTKASTDLYVQSNVWAPGGSTGWHSHPGQSLIIVTAGTVTEYEGRDPDCNPHVYKTGMAFTDSGDDHVHILRNEGIIEAKTIAVQFIQAGGNRRIEVANPGNCRF